MAICNSSRFIPIPIGSVFDRWTVIGMGVRSSSEQKWLCRCKCGTEREVVRSSLVFGRSKSCGCLSRESAKTRAIHGFCAGGRKQRWYLAWHAMMARCSDTKNAKYHRYGGRGIKVCERWHDKFAFFADMGESPPGLTLDRIDNNGDYEPGNCRWVDRLTQRHNQERTEWLTYNGRTMCSAQWAKELGIARSSLRRRLKKHSVEVALSMPVNQEMASIGRMQKRVVKASDHVLNPES